MNVVSVNGLGHWVPMGVLAVLVIIGIVLCVFSFKLFKAKKTVLAVILAVIGLVLVILAAYMILSVFSVRISREKNYKYLPEVDNDITVTVLDGADGPITAFATGTNDVIINDPMKYVYLAALKEADITEAKKIAEEYYKNITALYANKITGIRLDTEVSNSLWAVHGWGNELNTDAELFSPGHLVVFYVDNTVEGMGPRGIALGRRSANAQWKVVNEGL